MGFKLTGVTVATDGGVSAGTKTEVGFIDSGIAAATAISKVGSTDTTTFHSEAQMGMTAAVNLGVGFLAGDFFGNGRGRDGKGPLLKFGKV